MKPGSAIAHFFDCHGISLPRTPATSTSSQFNTATAPPPSSASQASDETFAALDLELSPLSSKQMRNKARLAELLPLPHNRAPGLTRSQMLFAIATRIDPRSLTIRDDSEYFLPTEPRERHQRATTPKDRVKAAEPPDEAPDLHRRTKGLLLPAKKNPRAIMDELNKTEIKVLDRIARQDFACTYLQSCVVFPPH